MCKKLTSLLLTIMILFSMVSITALAGEELADSSIYEAFSGQNACGIINDSKDEFRFFVSQPISVEPDTEYIVSVWSKGSGNPSVRILNATTWTGVANMSLRGSNAWTYSYTVFNSGDNETVLFSLTNNPYGAGGTMVVDNVYFAKLSDPETNLIINPGFEQDTGWNFREADTMFCKIYMGLVGGAIPNLSSIYVENPKTEYTLGDEFVKPDVYADVGTKFKPILTDACFTGYDMNKVGKQTVTVICDGHITTYDITVKEDDSDSIYNEEDYRVVKSQFPWFDWTNFPEQVPIRYGFEAGYAEDGEGYALHITGGNMGVRPSAGALYTMPAEFDLTDAEVVKLRYKATAPIDMYFNRAYQVSAGDAIPETEIETVKGILGDEYSSYFDEDGKNIRGAMWRKETKSSAVTLPSTDGVWQTKEIPITDFGDEAFLKTMRTNIVNTSFAPGYQVVFTNYQYGEDSTKYVTIDSITGLCEKTAEEIVIPGLDFAVEIGDIATKPGAATVDVPIRITEMFDNRMVGGFALKVTYDTDLLTWSAGDYTPGSSFPVPARNLEVTEPNGANAGSIRIDFSSYNYYNPITPETVAKDDLFVTLKFTVKDTTKDFTTDIGMVADSGIGTSNGTDNIIYDRSSLEGRVKGNTLKYSATFPFEAKVSDVAVPLGTTKVEVPVKFTKMFPDTDIDEIAVAVTYDAEKLSWTENGGYKTGSMISAPAADVVISEPDGAGKIIVSFATDVNPITPEAVARYNTFVTLTFTVKDPEVAFTTPVQLFYFQKTSYIPPDTLFPKEERINAFKAGTVTVGYAPEVVYGDASGDGKVNNDDLVYYKNYIQLDNPITDVVAADLNIDGRINYTDLVILKNFIELNVPIVK